MTPKREAFLRCCEWIAEHFADQEQSDEEEYFTDYSDSFDEGSASGGNSFTEESDEDTIVSSLSESDSSGDWGYDEKLFAD